MAERSPMRDILGRYGTGIALLVLLAFNLAVTPNFLSWQTLNVNLTQVCTIVIVAVGMTLVIATGGIDLSVGSLMAISGAVAPMIFMGKLVDLGSVHLAVGFAIVTAILVAALLGAFNGWLISHFRIQPIVATLVLFIAGRGIAQVITNGNLQVFKVPEFQVLGLGRLFGLPVQVILMLIIVTVVAWTLRRTNSAARCLPSAAMNGPPGCPASPQGGSRSRSMPSRARWPGLPD